MEAEWSIRYWTQIHPTLKGGILGYFVGYGVVVLSRLLHLLSLMLDGGGVVWSLPFIAFPDPFPLFVGVTILGVNPWLILGVVLVAGSTLLGLLIGSNIDLGHRIFQMIRGRSPYLAQLLFRREMGKAEIDISTMSLLKRITLGPMLFMYLAVLLCAILPVLFSLVT